MGLAPEMTCFLWYCQLYDVYCLSSSPLSDKSLSEPSFEWSATRTLAWCSCDLKTFWCPWNAEAASSVLGWRTCHVFLCDKLGDYSRLFSELQQLRDKAQEAQDSQEEEKETQEPEPMQAEEAQEEPPLVLPLAPLGIPSIPSLHQSCQAAFPHHLYLQHHPWYPLLGVNPKQASQPPDHF